MVENSDRYGRIIAGTDDEKRKAYSLIAWIGKVAAERLMKEPYLDIHIVKSTAKNMEHCAIVKCTRGIFYSIPRSILEPATKKIVHSVGIDRDDILPEEKYVRISPGCRQEALKKLAWIGDQTAERLVNESKLEVRKKQSGIEGLEFHCVVECSRKYLFPIPIEILEFVNNG